MFISFGRRRPLVTALGILSFAMAFAFQANAARADPPADHGRHVLLISVDGLHAFDLQQWTAQHPHSNLAQLANAGTTYSNAFASEPSDSFPGLIAQVTGGTPKTTGIFYDDSYTRNFWPADSAAPCVGTPPGVETTYFEAIDKTDAMGNIHRDTSIDPTKLPWGVIDGTCQRVYPHSFLKTNTIFNVAASADLYTAWSDKHPAYDIVRGPANTGANDLYTPEINTAVPTDPTTLGVPATIEYDTLKVRAVLNEIDGQLSNGGVRVTHGHPAPAVPAIFGMNFQAVSVGQKFEDASKWCGSSTPPPPGCDPNYVPGGYVRGSFAFTPQLTQALTFVDGAIGSFANELKAKGLSDSTEIIISAKHGQSPIDLTTLHKVGHAVTAVLTNAGISIAQITDDDIALVWLQDQHQTNAAVAALLADKHGPNTAKIDYILSGDALADKFGDPLHNNRTPDLIVQPVPGTIYTGSMAKVAEHGGFALDDTHVALLVVNGGDQHGGDQRGDSRDGGQTRTVREQVHTTQIAPTTLDFLGLDPEALQSVRLEGTDTLPR